MLEFATRHGAGRKKFNFRKLFIPIHCFYLIMLCLGYTKRFGAYCTPEPYPRIFFVLTASFFCIYALFRFMKYNDYFVEWSPKTKITQAIRDEFD